MSAPRCTRAFRSSGSNSIWARSRSGPPAAWAPLRRRAGGRAARPRRTRLLLPEPGGFFRRMREDDGTWLGHVLEHVAIELQNMAGEEVTFGKTRSAGARASTRWSTNTRSATKASPPANSRCGCCARCCPRRSAPRLRARGLELAGSARRVHPLAQRRALGPSTASLVRRPNARHSLAAPERSIAGAARPRQVQQRIQATVTSRTSHIAVELASDKEETNKILATLGLPVPKQELVQSEGRRCAPRSASAFRS
jgi:cyanophycin synthetase